MTYREEPGKQKTRRRRAQELSRSCAHENAWWKWYKDRIVQLAFGGDRSCVLRRTGPSVVRSPSGGENGSRAEPSFDELLVGGEPSTRRSVDESVGERGTLGKIEAEACVVVRGEFRNGGVVQMARH
jgi:hypothetical protein